MCSSDLGPALVFLFSLSSFCADFPPPNCAELLLPSSGPFYFCPSPRNSQTAVTISSMWNIPDLAYLLLQLCFPKSWYRHTFFSCALLYCPSWILHCLLLFENWRFVATLGQANLWVPFFQHLCSLCVSVSHFGHFHSISNFFIILFGMVICDHWCYCCKKIMTRRRFRKWSAFFF